MPNKPESLRDIPEATSAFYFDVKGTTEWPDKPCNGSNEGRLSNTRRAENRNNLSRFNLEGDWL
jgi:hypothetical protein